MIVPVMAISNLVLTQQIYSEETNGAHAHYREPVPLSGLRMSNDFRKTAVLKKSINCKLKLQSKGLYYKLLGRTCA